MKKWYLFVKLPNLLGHPVQHSLSFLPNLSNLGLIFSLTKVSKYFCAADENEAKATELNSLVRQTDGDKNCPFLLSFLSRVQS